MYLQANILCRLCTLWTRTWEGKAARNKQASLEISLHYHYRITVVEHFGSMKDFDTTCKFVDYHPCTGLQNQCRSHVILAGTFKYLEFHLLENISKLLLFHIYLYCFHIWRDSPNQCRMPGTKSDPSSLLFLNIKTFIFLATFPAKSQDSS